MLSAFVRVLRTPDLRKKLLFTLAIISVFRFGSFVPTPGVSYTTVRECVAESSNNEFLALANLFSGGALLSLSIFALGIMPYITASIIIQLLRVVIPRFEALHQEGQTGTAKLTQYTRYLTVGLALLQSSGFVAAAVNGQLLPGCNGIIPNDSLYVLILMVVTMTAGTGLVMWLGEVITERGVGNGMSLLIFTSIAAGFPSALGGIRSSKGLDIFLLVLAMGLVVMLLIVFVEQCQRRIPVQYAKRMIGRRTYGGSSTYIPMKVNMAGVIPVIFASSLLYLPQLISSIAGNPDNRTLQWVLGNLTDQSKPLHMVVYFAMIVFFTYFYVAITFNPEEVSTNMRKAGGFIPGIRAGKPTAKYLEYVLSRVTLPGALYLGLVALIPTIALVLLNVNANIPFGGTSILILVGVGLDTVRQIGSQLQQGHYEGFLK